jgi:hypothetical protein
MPLTLLANHPVLNHHFFGLVVAIGKVRDIYSLSTHSQPKVRNSAGQ